MNNQKNNSSKRKNDSGTNPKHESQHKEKGSIKVWLPIAFLAVLLLIGVGIWLYKHNRETPDEPPKQVVATAKKLLRESPLMDFLDSLTAQDIDSLKYYEIDDIPVY